MQIRVNLPPGSLVDYHHFCTAIAQAVCPADEQGFEGIDCIVGIEGLVAHRIQTHGAEGNSTWCLRGVQTALISEDGYTLDQLRRSDQDAATRPEVAALPLADPAGYQVIETLMRFVMSESDRRALEAVLPKLPPLRYPISADDAAAFMDAYLPLPGRPKWRPVLMTEADIERRRAGQAEARELHQKAIRDEFHAGRIVAVDSRHVPVAALVVGAYIPRDQAIAYLEGRGFAHSDMKSVEELGVARPLELEPSSEQATGQPSIVGQSKLTPRQRAEMVARCRKLKSDGDRAFAKQTAEEFGVSERTVSKWVRLAEKAEEEEKKQRLPASFFPTS